MGSIQNPRAMLGCSGEAQGTLSMCPAGGYLCLTDCWGLVLPRPKQTCWWCVMINLPEHLNLASILVSPVQDYALPQSSLGDFRSGKKLLYCLPHGNFHGDPYCPDGMFLLAARLNFHLFHFPRAQAAACTGTWLSSLCLFLVNLLPVLFKVSSNYLLIFLFLHEDTVVADELRSDLLPHWFWVGAHQNERAFIICSLVTLQPLSNI